MHMHTGLQQTWEHPAALSEGFSYGAEAQDDMQVGAHTLQEEGIQGVCSLPCTLCLCSRPDLIQHTNQLILGEQIRDLSCSNCPSCAWFGSQVKVTCQARLHLVCQEHVQAIVSLAVPTGVVHSLPESNRGMHAVYIAPSACRHKLVHDVSLHLCEPLIGAHMKALT